jgi:EmrB/QacA subfamily drug resistance transporter
MPDFSKAERRVTLLAVAIVFLLSAMDQTIVATAMPHVAAELHGLALYSWVTTAYLLTSTMMIPIWGKLGDQFGRKPVLLWSIGIFLAGSWLSGLSGEIPYAPGLGGGMIQLIVWRAVQGVGGAGLFTVPFAIIADLYSAQERAKMGGLFGAIFALASAVGPLLGGYFTDHGTVTLGGHTIAGWRWVFYVNLPLSLLSLFLVVTKTPRMPGRAAGKVDVLGALLIIATAVPLLLALTIGGRSRPWGSAPVLGLFAAAAAALAAYVAAERRTAHPMLPLALFRNRVFWTANLAGFLVAMSFMSTVTFLPLFLQVAQALPATASGLALLPLVLGLIVSSTVCGRMVARTGRYKPVMLGGVAVAWLGILFLSRVDMATGRLDFAWRLGLLGIGLGPGQSLFSLAIQNAVPLQKLGIATSATQFFRQIGSTIGVALFGALLVDQLETGLKRHALHLDLDALQGFAHHIQGGAPALPIYAKAIVATAITKMLSASLVVMSAAAGAILLIPEIPMASQQQTVVGDNDPAQLGANP